MKETEVQNAIWDEFTFIKYKIKCTDWQSNWQTVFKPVGPDYNALKNLVVFEGKTEVTWLANQ